MLLSLEPGPGTVPVNLLANYTGQNLAPKASQPMILDSDFTFLSLFLFRLYLRRDQGRMDFGSKDFGSNTNSMTSSLIKKGYAFVISCTRKTSRPST